MTTETKAATHTPGPWFTTKDHVNGQSEAFVLATIPDSPWVVYADRKQICDDAEADVRLIAAAPDLLQLLREARELLNDQDTELNLIDWLTAAETVIAKAEGRA